MLVVKTRHSVFLPELVLSELLVNNFPSWRRETQLESVRWMIKRLRNFFTAHRPRGGIVNSRNQLLYENEVSDSRHITLWSCTVLVDTLKHAVVHPTLFAQACTPVLYNLAFRGEEKELMAFLQTLRDEFDRASACIGCEDHWHKRDIVHHVHQFEAHGLARVARCTARRALAQHSILFGGMVYACAFSLAFVRLLWMDRRTQLLMNHGIIPMFR